MKLAKLVLPTRDNVLTSMWGEHQDVRAMLADAFGGYTQTMGAGGWKRPDGKVQVEPVVVYDIAMERAAVIKLRDIAAEVAKLCRQGCVMIVTPNGDVEFIKPKGE